MPGLAPASLMMLTTSEQKEERGRSQTPGAADFLLKHMKIRESEVFKVLQDLRGDAGVGIEAASAWSCLDNGGLPGRKAAGLPAPEPYERYIHHFPDGNASIARLLVREMIPAAAPGNTMDDVVTARFDYSKLDHESSAVRLRLNSTVVEAQHDGDPKTAKQVLVTYIRGGHAYRVRARSCVLACYHSAIPYLCPARGARAPGQDPHPLFDRRLARLAGLEEARNRRSPGARELSQHRDARLSRQPRRLLIRQEPR